MSHNIFVSKPNQLNQQQSDFVKAFEDLLHQRTADIQSLGTVYSNTEPVTAVKNMMVTCVGAAVLGLKQMHVVDGFDRKGTPKQTPVKDIYLPTAWNHIEAGMAFMLDLPLFIIREQGVTGGAFEVGNSARFFIHEVTLPHGNWLTTQQFLQPFNQWWEEVILRKRPHGT